MFLHTDLPPSNYSYSLIFYSKAWLANLSADIIKMNISITGISASFSAMSSRISWSPPYESHNPGQSIIVIFPFPSNHYSPLFISIFEVTDVRHSSAMNMLLFVRGSDPYNKWQNVLLPDPVLPIMQTIGSLNPSILLRVLACKNYMLTDVSVVEFRSGEEP